MHGKVVDYCIKRIYPEDMELTEEELDNIRYVMNAWIYNLLQTIFLLVIASFLGVIKGTLVALLSFFILRRVAAGWHAKTLTGCYVASTVSFLLLPIAIYQFPILRHEGLWLFIGGVSLLSFFLYAPADTASNPLVSVSERKKRKIYTLFIGITLLLVSCLFSKIQPFIILGMLTEGVLISKIFYKITGKEWKNYENYEQEP